MNLKSTLTKCGSLILGTFLVFSFSNANAQTGCANENIIWTENFGSGTAITSDANVINFTYQASGPLESEGIYRVASNSQQKSDWHASADHTGNSDGRMLVVNGQAQDFYQKIITNPSGFAEGTYSVSLWGMEVNTFGICGLFTLEPVLSIKVEYLDQSNNWVAFQGSPYTAAPLILTATPTWVNIGSYFNLPTLGTSAPTQLRITIADGTGGGCGNDFAIDDLKFAQCPEGGPTPVTFVDVTAKQKGAGVSIDWSTSQEINNNYFEAERSADGNSGWQTVGHVNGAGNSQVAHHYSAFDANPLSGISYYRIKQVDRDGKASFSKTVYVKVENAGSRVSVLANPFHGTIKVQFSGAAQQVQARLLDITGKQVARESWNVSNGESTQQFSNVSNLNNGIYILSVQNRNGEVLFNGKVIKQ